MPQMFLLSRVLACLPRTLEGCGCVLVMLPCPGSPRCSHTATALTSSVRRVARGDAHIGGHTQAGTGTGTGTCMSIPALLAQILARALTQHSHACMCIHTHLGLHLRTPLGVTAGRNARHRQILQGLPSSSHSKKRFPSSAGALPSSNPSHCSTVAWPPGAGGHLLWLSTLPEKFQQGPSLQSHAAEPCLPLPGGAWQDLSSLLLLQMLPAAVRSLRTRAGQDRLPVTAPAAPGIFHGVISHRPFPPSLTCL